MATAQLSEHSHVGNGSPTVTPNANDLAAESRHGADLAQALIEHISRMHAAGYHNELLVDGEVWTIEAKRRSAAN